MLKTKEGTSSERWSPPCYLHVSKKLLQLPAPFVQLGSTCLRSVAGRRSDLSLPLLLCCVHVKVDPRKCQIPPVFSPYCARGWCRQQIKITRFCFRSCLYFISLVSEHLINKGKWTITSSKQSCSEIPQTIQSQGKQFIASDASVLGILAILGNTSLCTQISLIACIFIVLCSLVSRQNQSRLFHYWDGNFA